MARINKQNAWFGVSLATILLLLSCMPGRSAYAQAKENANFTSASGTTTNATAAQSGTQASTVGKESLVIGPGDLVHISVFDEPEMEQKVRVNDAGEIYLNLIGKVKIAGMTSSQAAAAIRDKYQAGSFLNNPQVSVFVEEYSGESVSLLGQFQHPGPVTLTSPRSLLDVISMGGGLTDIADRNLVIQRKSGEKINVFVPNKPNKALQESSVMVYPGDLVMAPKAGIVYVLGDVARPGGYVMNNDSQLTVLQALAMAAGTNRTAKENKARLVRKENDKLTEIQLKLTAMQKGKAPDMPLQPNDIIWVPASWVKTIAQGASGIAASATSAIIYTRP